MPLYKVTDGDKTRLIYAKTARGAIRYVVEQSRPMIQAAAITPLEAAVLAANGVPVETVDKGEDKVMANDPPEARRKPPQKDVVDQWMEGLNEEDERSSGHGFEEKTQRTVAIDTNDHYMGRQEDNDAERNYP